MGTGNRITFLLASIEDAQELIKFADSKTAIVISIIGGYILAIFSSMPDIVRFSCYYDGWIWTSLALFTILLILCIQLALRIIKPTSNPSQHINFEGRPAPILLFFLTPNKYKNKTHSLFRNRRRSKLSIGYNSYESKIQNATNEDIIASLTFELMKVSFIRNIKIDRFNLLIKILICLTISFIAYYLIFTIETDEIKSLLNNGCCNCP